MALLAIIVITSSNAQNANTDENKLANKGYDVVNYFNTNSAQKGSIEFSKTNDPVTRVTKDHMLIMYNLMARTEIDVVE